MNSSIKKLPGTKKEFPFVKPVVDSRRRVKPDQLPSPESVYRIIPKHKYPVTMADFPHQNVETPSKPRNGYGFRGFGSTSITPVVPRDKITRPLLKEQDKSQSRPSWNISQKVKEEKPIITKTGSKPTDVEIVKGKSFKARPVPRSHYEKPFQPVLPSKKAKEGNKNIVTELASRLWHTVVDPIFPPKEQEDDKLNDDEQTDVKREAMETAGKAPHSTSHSPLEEETDKVSPMEDEAEPAAQPGIASRVRHTVVYPLFHPENLDDEKITPATEDETEEEPEAKKSEILEDPPGKTPALDPTFPPNQLDDEKPDDEEGTVPQPNDKEAASEAPHSNIHSSLEEETDKVSPVEDETEPTAKPGLVCRVWHSVLDPIFHPEKLDDEKITPATEHETEEEPEAKKFEVLEDPEVDFSLMDPILTQKELDDEKLAGDEGADDKPEENETASEALHITEHSPSEVVTDKGLPMEDEAEPSAQPGLVCRVLHSVVDRIFHPKKEDDEDPVDEASSSEETSKNETIIEKPSEAKDDETLLAEAAGSQMMETEHHRRPFSDNFLLSKLIEEMDEKRAANRKLFQKKPDVVVEPLSPDRRKSQQKSENIPVDDERQSGDTKTPKKVEAQKKKQSRRKRSGKND